MKTITMVAALICSSAAHADCVQWGRDQHNNRVCMMDDLLNRNPVVPETSIMGPPGVTITNTPMPKCPDSYQLVLRGSGQPACARDVIDPQ